MARITPTGDTRIYMSSSNTSDPASWVEVTAVGDATSQWATTYPMVYSEEDLETQSQMNALTDWGLLEDIRPEDLMISVEWTQFEYNRFKVETSHGYLPVRITYELGEFARIQAYGDPPPKDLQAKIMKEFERIKEKARLRAEEAAIELYKHKLGCPYRINDPTDYACSCQPHTLFGKTRTWYCYICELPLAPVRDGVCANCEPLEYGSERDGAEA